MPVIIDGTNGVNASAITTTNWTPTNIATGGNTTLGDAAGDSVTFNASNVSAPNNLNIASNSIKSSGSAVFFTQGSSNLTSLANNAFTVGSVAKNVAASGGAGQIVIMSNDPSASALSSFIALMTDATAANRRLQIGCIEQGTAWRNISLAEFGGSVGVGSANPAGKLHVAGDSSYQAVLSGSTNTNKRMYVGYDTTADAGKINAFEETVGVKNLLLQTLGGNVGINTSTPTVPLLISTTSTSAVQPILHLGYNGSMTSGVNGSYMSFGNANPTSNQLARIAGYYEGGTYMGSLRFYTNSNTDGVNLPERMRIDNDGKLLLGLSSSQSNNARLQVKRADATVGASTYSLGWLQNATGYEDGLNVLATDGGVTIAADYSGQNHATSLRFATNNSNGAFGAIERVRINETGAVLIATNTPDSTTSTTAKLHVLGPTNGLVAADVTGHVFATFAGAQAGTTDAGWGGGLLLKPIVSRGSSVFLGALNDSTNMEGPAAFVIRSGGYATNTAERFRISADGKVGIGVTNPTYPLSVNGPPKMSNSGFNFTSIDKSASTGTVTFYYGEMGGNDMGDNLSALVMFHLYQSNDLIPGKSAIWIGLRACHRGSAGVLVPISSALSNVSTFSVAASGDSTVITCDSGANIRVRMTIIAGGGIGVPAI